MADENSVSSGAPGALTDNQLAQVAGGRPYGYDAPPEQINPVTGAGVIAGAIGAAGKAIATAIANGKG